MSDITFARTPQTEAECEKALAQILADIRRLNEEMRQDDLEIDRNRAESQRLKEEGARLDADFRARWDALNATLDRITGGV
jgi:hypothetical protein